MTRHKTDVLILGGGVIGLTAAYFLLQKGRSVCVVEQSTVGSGSSHANCGLITPSHVAPLTMPGTFRKAWSLILDPRSPLLIKPTLSPSRLLWFLRTAQKCNEKDAVKAMTARAAMLASSRKLFSALMQDHDLACQWEEKGLFVAYKTAKALHEEDEMDELLKRYGVEVDVLSSVELLDREPAFRRDVYGARYYPWDAHLKPDLLMAELLRVVREMGAVVMEECPANGFVTGAAGIEGVETPQGNLTASEYVVAAGAWTPKLTSQLGVRIPIQPGKGYAITMERPGVCLSTPSLLAERNMAVTPWPSGFRLGGTMEFSGYNNTLNAARLDALVDGAKDYLQEPVGPGKLEYWTGWRPMSFDELPFIGRSPRVNNLTVAAGHGMLGVTMGPGTGKLVSEIVTGQEAHIDPRPFAIDRI